VKPDVLDLPLPLVRLKLVRAQLDVTTLLGVGNAGSKPDGRWNRTRQQYPFGVRSANPIGVLEQPRDALGRFLPKTGGEVSPGSLAEGAIWDAIEAKPGWQVTRGRIYATDATGQIRVFAGYALSPGGRVIGLEIKSGAARLTAAQRAFDTRLNSSYLNKAQGIGERAGLQIDRALEIHWP
jgi:hypothetical protein